MSCLLFEIDIVHIPNVRVSKTPLTDQLRNDFLDITRPSFRGYRNIVIEYNFHHDANECVSELFLQPIFGNCILFIDKYYTKEGYPMERDIDDVNREFNILCNEIKHRLTNMKRQQSKEQREYTIDILY